MTITCLICSKQFNAVPAAKRKYCSISCYTVAQTLRLGENRYNWKGGRGKCTECGALLSKYNYPARGVKRCKRCYLKSLHLENHPSWKGGISKTKEYKAHYSRLKRDKRRGAVGTHTMEAWYALKVIYDNTCLSCKKVEPEISLTRDHIVPLSRGGTNYITNLQPLCRSCNGRKYTKIKSYI